MARSPHFSLPTVTKKGDTKSVLPKLTNQGNLLAGATARIGVGFLLNPFSVLKARFEVCCTISLVPHATHNIQSDHFAYRSLTGSLVSIVRTGPSELMRGFVASSLRDAPYAGLFVLLYEGVKRESSKSMFPDFGRCLRHLQQLFLYQAHTPQLYIAFLQRPQGALQRWLLTLSMLSRYSYNTQCMHDPEKY